MKKQTTEEQTYVAPEVRVIEIAESALICTSNEGVGEDLGRWII